METFVPFVPKGNVRGFIMPDFIFTDNRLSLGAKTLYALFCNYAGESDHCWPSHKTLSKKLGCSITSIKTYIDQLIHFSYLICKNKDNYFRSCMYFLLIQKSAKVHLPVNSQNLATPQPNIDYNLNLSEFKKKTPISPHNSNTTKPKAISPQNNYRGGCFSSMNKEFEKFWNIYPRKEAKELARAIWSSMYRNKQLPQLQVLQEAVQGNILSNNSWQKENGRYIPMCVNWLKGQRWCDGSFESVALQSSVGINNNTKNTQQFIQFTEKELIEKKAIKDRLETLRPLFNDFAKLFKSGINAMAFATWAYLHGKGIKLNNNDIPSNVENISLCSWLLEKKRILHC